MKRIIPVVISALVLAGTAAAAPAPGKLGRQIAVLKREVSALRGRVAVLEADLDETRNSLGTLAVVAACGDALLWDGWDAIVVVLGLDPGPPIDDGGACAELGIVRRSAPSPGRLGALRALAGRGYAELAP